MANRVVLKSLFEKRIRIYFMCSAMCGRKRPLATENPSVRKTNRLLYKCMEATNAREQYPTPAQRGQARQNESYANLFRKLHCFRCAAGCYLQTTAIELCVLLATKLCEILYDALCKATTDVICL